MTLSELRERCEAMLIPVSVDDRITTLGAAAVLGVHVQTVRRLSEEGRLRRVRLPLAGGCWSYRLTDILEFSSRIESE